MMQRVPILTQLNDIESITQENTATGDGFAAISQSNDATINQNLDLLNSCGESGAGFNEATCANNEARNFIGPVVQTNTATGDASDTFTQSNVVDVTQNLQGTNDCDEANTGNNFAECGNNISNNIASITQTNTIDPLAGTQSHDQSNLFAVTQNLVATNDCDESGLGDNIADCFITQSNDIGAITQSNTASSNVLTINQDGQATNDCDDTTSGDNTANCTIDLHLVVPDITQTGDETLNIDQHENLVNSCPGTGTCSISITRTFDPNAPLQTLSASTTAAADSNTDDGGDEKTGSQSQPLTLSTLKTAEAQTDSDTSNTANVNSNNDDNTNTNNNNNDDTTDPNDSSGNIASTQGAVETTSSSSSTVEQNDNTGDDNTGDDNTGDDNTGDDNTGDDNTGDDNTGDDNTGDDNTGDDNTGDDNTKMTRRR